MSTVNRKYGFFNIRMKDFRPLGHSIQSAMNNHHVDLQEKGGFNVSDCWKDIQANKNLSLECPKCGLAVISPTFSKENPLCIDSDVLINTNQYCPQCIAFYPLRNFIGWGQLQDLKFVVDAWCKLNGQAMLAVPASKVGNVTVPNPQNLAHKVMFDPLHEVKPTEVIKDEISTPQNESDKPVGTRDVEKYLKEQQNKLWEGLL